MQETCRPQVKALSAKNVKQMSTLSIYLTKGRSFKTSLCAEGGTHSDKGQGLQLQNMI